LITLDIAMAYAIIIAASSMAFYFICSGIAALKFTGKITTAIEKVSN